MARCEECLHFEVCEALEQGNGLMKVSPIHCGYYKNAADVAPKSEVVAEIINAFDNYISEMTVSKYGTLQECKDAKWAVKTAVNFVLGEKKYTEEKE